LALRGLFERQIAACELSGPRPKLKNSINTLLSNQLCRSANELCTKQAEDSTDLGQDLEKSISKSDRLFRNAEYVAEQCLVLCKENRALLTENQRSDLLCEYQDRDIESHSQEGAVRQYQSALMHYNELQS
jgi:hypothetical protein